MVGATFVGRTAVVTAVLAMGEVLRPLRFLAVATGLVVAVIALLVKEAPPTQPSS